MERGKYGKHLWAKEDIDFLKKNHPHMNNRQLADALGIRLTTCRKKMYELGLKRMELQYWTAAQTAYLIEHYPTKGDTELAQDFAQRWPKKKGWNKKHMEKKRRQMNLKRTPAQNKAIHRRNVDLGYFRLCPVKAWKTRGGGAPEGEVRIWNREGGKIAVVKTKEGFVHYNRWLYEQHHGPLGPEQLVVTRSGKVKARGVDDLEVIDRSEHAARNSQNRYPIELQQTLQLLRKINKEITD